MDIEVKNTEAAIATCDDILSYNQQIVSHIDQLDDLISSVNSTWESTGMDKESYIQELQKQAGNLTKMSELIGNTARSISGYAQRQQQTSNKTM